MHFLLHFSCEVLPNIRVYFPQFSSQFLNISFGGAFFHVASEVQRGEFEAACCFSDGFDFVDKLRVLSWPCEMGTCPHQPVWVEADKFLLYYSFASELKFVGQDKRVFRDLLNIPLSVFLPH